MPDREANQIIRFGSFEVDPRIGEIRRSGLRIKLQGQPFQVLALLLERPGELVTRDDLRRRLWPVDTFVDFEHSLNAAVKRLRDALGDDPENPRFIETVPRRGYRFLASVSVTDIGEPRLGQPATGDYQLTDAVSAFLFRSPGRVILLALAILAVLGVGTTSYVLHKTTSDPSTRTIPLTNFPGAEDQAAFSGNGDEVAFVWDRNTSEGTDVYVKRIGTDPPLQLSKSHGFVCCPTWSSDDRYVAFSRCSGDNPGIFLVQSLGGSERQLRKTRACGGISWSPTEQFLAFAEKSSQESPYALFLMSVEDLQAHQLTFPTGNVVGDQDPVFSPDGKSVAFLRITSEASVDIYTVSVSGGKAIQRTFDKGVVFGFTWSADGNKIIFSSHRDGGQSLWTIPLSGGEPQRLPFGGAAASDPTISRRGNKLAYTQGLIHPNLWAMDVPESKSRVSEAPVPFVPSATYNSGPQFSPDGKKVAFVSASSGYTEIWTCAATDCSEPQQLTFLKVLSSMPRWSPDNNRIVFESRPKGHSQIFLVNVNGGRSVALTDGKAEDKVASWSSDGAFIYFSSNRGGSSQIWKLKVSGGVPSQVTLHGGFNAFESSDGKLLYYTKEDESGIWRMPAGGGDEIEVVPQLSPEYWGDWALSNRGIYYIRGVSKHPLVEFFDISSHKVSKIAALSSPPPMYDPGFAVSPDGKRILFSQVDNSGVDIMLVENFH